MTPAQLEAFQRTHRNHLGAPLLVDGKQGPQTEWALDFETLCKPRQAIVVVAQSFLGLEEVPPGSNDDPNGLIRGWLRRCAAPAGSPWCASFACHCLSAVADVRIAGAQRLGLSFPDTSAPTAGDLFWYATDHIHGHVGIVIGVSASEVMTIEGNQRHAVRCLRRPRRPKDGPRLRFSRILPDTEGTCPGVVPSVPLPSGGTR
jgi:hypothetical protein